MNVVDDYLNKLCKYACKMGLVTNNLYHGRLGNRFVQVKGIAYNFFFNLKKFKSDICKV